MDPDAALEELRRLMLTIFGRKQPDADAERMAELFCGLDAWLKKGERPPKDWAQARKR